MGKEAKGKRQTGWIIISLDSPFWGWSPFNFDRGHILKSTVEYIRGGEETGRLFTASKPVSIQKF